ncbi:SWIM zinc finger family protein [Nocardiopsis sp. JB363]|uniref:SWIM zinc finger family protein n=1 Tax=Nocardiopsis sp. JB363 TaxID=1434837 RepID=UPI00097B75C4|nr:SWIM zinc finger family protein [Nocardiopsis sp. JB363]SIO85566.1 hypothetical protein BQ8420_07600 [Nocardiopsis sp. JB363]
MAWNDPNRVNWWSDRLLRGVDDGDRARRSRGRSYFAGGAVRRLTVDPDLRQVGAHVQGSRGRPYRVSIGSPFADDALWERALGELGRISGAREDLLDGLMPEGSEDVFARHGALLFPDSVDDLVITCNCPDHGGHPCKHGAAVLFALAEWSDHEPLVLFAWSGWTEEAVFDALGPSGGGSSGELSVEVEPLIDRAADFWEAGTGPATLAPRPFDPLAYWEGATTGIASRLAPMYAALARPEEVGPQGFGKAP